MLEGPVGDEGDESDDAEGLGAPETDVAGNA